MIGHPKFEAKDVSALIDFVEAQRAARRPWALLPFDSPAATGISTTRTDGLTHIYGQIVDLERNVVAGNQATPIPIKLEPRR